MLIQLLNDETEFYKLLCYDLFISTPLASLIWIDNWTIEFLCSFKDIRESVFSFCEHDGNTSSNDMLTIGIELFMVAM